MLIICFISIQQNKLKQEPKGLISERLINDNLVKVLIGLNSHEYRAVTNEVLTFGLAQTFCGRAD